MDEVKVVDPVTGGTKGSKMARFDMIPSDVLWELAEHYGRGEQKYPSDADGTANWQRGYNWRLSVAALQRHLHQFILGESLDEETGSSHLISIIWHAVALRWFELHGKGTDYRTKEKAPLSKEKGLPVEKTGMDPRLWIGQPETEFLSLSSSSASTD